MNSINGVIKKNNVHVPDGVGEYMHQHIPHSKLATVNTKGHFPHISVPEEVIGAIRSFIG